MSLGTSSGLPDNGLDLMSGIYVDALGAEYLLIAISQLRWSMVWIVTYALLVSTKGNKVWSMPVEQFLREFKFKSTNPNAEY